MYELHAHFSKYVEILNVIETLVTNQLQIIAYDYEEAIYFVLTWNFDYNMEQSCKQFKATDIENSKNYCYVVKGMN